MAAAAVDGPVDLVVADCDACALGADRTASSVRVDASAIAGGEVRVIEGGTVSAVEPSRRPTRTFSRRSLFRRGDPAERAAQVGASSGSDRTPRALLLDAVPLPNVAQPVIGDACTGCEACVRTCPADALSGERGFGGLRLLLEAQRCVGCGDCVRLCPASAVTLEVRAAPPGPRLLQTVPDRSCDRCGTSLASGEDGECTRCRTRASLAADALAHLFG